MNYKTRPAPPPQASRSPVSFEQRLLEEARRAPLLAALRNFPRVERTDSPAWAKKRTVTGAKAQGYVYEKKVGKILAKLCNEKNWKLWDHQWFVYNRGTEIKYFQPDFVIERPNEQGILLEVKLTYTDASEQFNKYTEYLKLYGVECFPVTVVKNLTPGVLKDLIVDDFDKIQPNSVWHLWI